MVGVNYADHGRAPPGWYGTCSSTFRGERRYRTDGRAGHPATVFEASRLRSIVDGSPLPDTAVRSRRGQLESIPVRHQPSPRKVSFANAGVRYRRGLESDDDLRCAMSRRTVAVAGPLTDVLRFWSSTARTPHTSL